MLPNPEWKAEDQPRVQDSWGNNNADNKNGDIPGWMFREKSNQKETKKIVQKKEDPKKKPAQPKENDNCA